MMCVRLSLVWNGSSLSMYMLRLVIDTSECGVARYPPSRLLLICCVCAWKSSTERLMRQSRKSASGRRPAVPISPWVRAHFNLAAITASCDALRTRGIMVRAYGSSHFRGKHTSGALAMDDLPLAVQEIEKYTIVEFRTPSLMDAALLDKI